MTGSGEHGRSGLKSLLANMTLVVVSCVGVVLFVEVVLRLFPGLFLPAGTYGAGRRHPELGMNVHGQRLIYNKTQFLERIPNREGFMDVDHEEAKPAGMVRIGFFGDSFVESIQVPLEQVFFRRLGALLPRNVESLAFGLSGWGTLQAERAFEVFAPKYGLDIAVYLFVENDPGNNCLDISAASDVTSGMPFADLRPDGQGYDVRWITEPGHEAWWFAAGKFIQRHSLLAHVVLDRLAMLRAYGVRAGADVNDTQMSGVAAGVPLPTDLPSTWPVSYRDEAERLGELLLKDWRDSAASRGVRFLVLYVPRGEEQLAGTLPLEDTWLPWLRTVCQRLGIPLVDPSRALHDALEGDGHVYDDHWTPLGHEVVSRVLAESLAPLVPVAGPGQSPAPADTSRN